MEHIVRISLGRLGADSTALWSVASMVDIFGARNQDDRRAAGLMHLSYTVTTLNAVSHLGFLQ